MKEERKCFDDVNAFSFCLLCPPSSSLFKSVCDSSHPLLLIFFLLSFSVCVTHVRYFCIVSLSSSSCILLVLVIVVLILFSLFPYNPSSLWIPSYSFRSLFFFLWVVAASVVDLQFIPSPLFQKSLSLSTHSSFSFPKTREGNEVLSESLLLCHERDRHSLPVISFNWNVYVVLKSVAQSLLLHIEQRQRTYGLLILSFSFILFSPRFVQWSRWIEKSLLAKTVYFLFFVSVDKHNLLFSFSGEWIFTF